MQRLARGSWLGLKDIRDQSEGHTWIKTRSKDVTLLFHLILQTPKHLLHSLLSEHHHLLGPLPDLPSLNNSPFSYQPRPSPLIMLASLRTTLVCFFILALTLVSATTIPVSQQTAAASIAIDDGQTQTPVSHRLVARAGTTLCFPFSVILTVANAQQAVSSDPLVFAATCVHQ